MKRCSQIIRVGPKCSHIYPYKRETEGDVAHKEEKEIMWSWRDEARNEESQQSLEAGRGKDQIVLWSLEKSHGPADPLL